MADAADQNLEPGYLIIDWGGIEGHSEMPIEKCKVEHAEYSLNTHDSWPLNGKMVRLSVLSMELGFSSPEGASRPWPGIMFEINATPEKMGDFGEVGTSLHSSDYVCTDEWEVMTTLYRYEHFNMLDTVTTVLAKTPSTITLSISGRFKHVNYADDVTDRPHPKFSLQHEFPLN